MFCPAQAAVTTSAGDNSDYESTPINACANDASFASDVNSGNSTSTTCSNTGKDKHKFLSFGVGAAVPASPTPTIDGIEIRMDAWGSFTSPTQTDCVELSWDGGTSWTAAKTQNLSTSQTTYTWAARLTAGVTSGRKASFRMPISSCASLTCRAALP